MKSRTTILLIVALLIVIGLIVVQRTELLRPSERTDESAPALWADEPGEVVELQIRMHEAVAGVQTVRFVRGQDGWRIAEPFEARARGHWVDRLVRAVREPLVERAYDSSQPDAPGPDVTGLDAPTWTLTLRDEQRRSFILDIGRAVPLSGGAKTYVRPDTGPISKVLGAKPSEGRAFVVAEDFAALLSREVSDYRDPLVLDVPTDTVERLVVEGRRRVDLVRKEDRWRLVAPRDVPASEAGVNRLLNALTRVSAEGFLPAPQSQADRDLAPYGLQPGGERLVVRIWTRPPGVATTEPADRKPDHTLALGNVVERRIYGRLDGAGDVLLLPASLWELLQADPDDLRNRRVLDVTPLDVRRVEIDVPDGQTTLIRDEDGWRMEDPYAGSANARAVRELLEAVDALRAGSFRDEPDAAEALGLAPPRGSIVLHQAGRQNPLVLGLGEQSLSDGTTFVRGGDGAVAVVNTADVAAIFRGPAEYWNTLLLELPSGVEITEIARRDGEEIRLALLEGQWRLASASGEGAADTNAVNRLLDPLERLQASRIVSLSEEVPPRYARAEGVEVRLVGRRRSAETQASEEDPPGEDAPFVAHIRAVRMEGNTYVWVLGETPSAVGEFAPTLLDDLQADLREKLLLRFDPEQIQTIEVAAGERTVHLRRENGQWGCPSDPHVPIDGEKVFGFLRGLSATRADRFAELDGDDEAVLMQAGLDEPWLAVTLTDAAGGTHNLAVSHSGPDAHSRYAAANGVHGVLVVSGAAAARMAVTLENFESLPG